MYIASQQETERVNCMGGATQLTDAGGSRGGSNLPATSPITDALESVMKHLRKAPILNMAITEEESGYDEEPREPCKIRKVMKSGKIWTANTMKVKQITWPHDWSMGWMECLPCTNN